MTRSRINANTPTKFNRLHTGSRGNVATVKINRASTPHKYELSGIQLTSWKVDPRSVPITPCAIAIYF